MTQTTTNVTAITTRAPGLQNIIVLNLLLVVLVVLLISNWSGFTI